VLHEGKTYFWMMIELMCFVFVILFTESAKIHNTKKLQEEYNLNLQIILKYVEENQEFRNRLIKKSE
jgi:abortive infection bacteriophage resistance protein